MKRIVILMLLSLVCNNLFSFVPEDVQRKKDLEVKKKLEEFCYKIATPNETEDSLVKTYGKPDKIKRKKTGYLNDETIIYEYLNIGQFTFFYKTDEKKIYLWSVNLNSNFIDIINFPTTMDGVDNYFNTKFTRRISQLNPGNIYLGYYGEFSINFIFKESDNKLYQINWILH